MVAVMFYVVIRWYDYPLYNKWTFTFSPVYVDKLTKRESILYTKNTHFAPMYFEL